MVSGPLMAMSLALSDASVIASFIAFAIALSTDSTVSSFEERDPLPSFEGMEQPVTAAARAKHKTVDRSNLDIM